MALFQKLLIRQSQALVMTPQLMQAIKLLQLSHLDLAAYVDGELEKNPLLERPAEEEPVRGEVEPAHEASGTDEEPRHGLMAPEHSLVQGRRVRMMAFGVVAVRVLACRQQYADDLGAPVLGR